jgi:HD-GYP domain-containing protein (c-di-GMP phosphodiesterase class II)
VAEIARGRGQQFDPDVVDAFLGIPEEAAVDLRRESMTMATEVLVRLHSDPENE